MNRFIRTAARVVLVSVLLGGTSFASQTGRTPVTSEQLMPGYQREERAFLIDQEKTLDAKQLRQALLREAQDTHQQLQTLSELATSFSHKMNTLLDNDAGKRIARDGGSFLTYLELRDYWATVMDQIAPKLDSASALLNRLKQAEDGPDVGFVPSDKTQQDLRDLRIWAKVKLGILDAQIATLDTIVRDAPQDIDLAKTKPLRIAIQEYKARWNIKSGQQQVLAQRLASADVNDTFLLGFYRAEIERVMCERDQILLRKQAEIEQIRHEAELARLKREQQHADELSAAKIQYENKLAEIQRKEKAAETDRAIQDRTAAIERDTKTSEVNRQELIARAKSPEVQQSLAPFIAPGYWQPRQPRPTYNKMPVSLNALRTVGALRQTPDGLRVLLDCGMNRGDKERPRWPFRARYIDLTADEHEQLRQAQDYLIQLGDILVELGMLSK